MKIVLMVFAALFLLLLCPVRLCLHWKNELSVTAKWLFLKFRLMPRPEPKKDKPEKAPKAPQEASPAGRKDDQPSPADTLTQYAGLLPDLLGGLKNFAVYILRHTRVNKLRLDMLVAKDDAAETAIAFGRANQAVYTALGLLQNLLPFGCKPQINIGFDYLGKEEEAEVWLTVSLAPLFALLGAIGFAAGLLWNLVIHKNS